MGLLSFSKLVVASSLVSENYAILIGSDQADGGVSDNEQNVSDEDVPLNFTEESSSIAVDDNDESAVEHSYFETGSTIEKQFEGMDMNMPDDMSEGSSCAPICKPLPSGHIMQVNKQPTADGTESVFTRVSQRDASWNSMSENSLGDDLNQLFTACRSGDCGVVKRLLDNPDVKMDVNHRIDGKDWAALRQRLGMNLSSTTPLILASFNGHAAVIEQLLTCSEIEINKTDKKGEYTALRTACQFGHSAVVTLLLDQEGVDINKAPYGNNSPLITASRFGHPEIVRLLVARPEINLNYQNSEDETALMYASEYGYSDIVRVLLDHPDIDANIKNDRDKSSLDIASDQEVIEQLILTVSYSSSHRCEEDEIKNRIRAGRAEIVQILQDYFAQKK